MDMTVAHLEVGVRAEQHPLDHPSKVPQVKDIVRLGGGRQEILHRSPVDCHRGLHQHPSVPWEEGQGRPVKAGPAPPVPGPHPGRRGPLSP